MEAIFGVVAAIAMVTGGVLLAGGDRRRRHAVLCEVARRRGGRAASGGWMPELWLELSVPGAAIRVEFALRQPGEVTVWRTSLCPPGTVAFEIAESRHGWRAAVGRAIGAPVVDLGIGRKFAARFTVATTSPSARGGRVITCVAVTAEHDPDADVPEELVAQARALGGELRRTGRDVEISWPGVETDPARLEQAVTVLRSACRPRPMGVFR